MLNKAYHPVPVALEHSGKYMASGEGNPTWIYRYTVEHAGTKSERREGELWVDEKLVAPPTTGGVIETPWGRMYWATGAYRAGWLVAGPQDEQVLGDAVAFARLPGSGRWVADAENWSYGIEISAAYSKSERRTGTLSQAGSPLEGGEDGQTLKTPWGVCRWCDRSPYEQGWLFVGCYDRPWTL